MMNKEARDIVANFKDGYSVEHVAKAWSIPREVVEGLLREALKAQDKKKGKA